MRYAIIIATLLLISAITPHQFIPAQTSQNIEWILPEGTRLNYTLTVIDAEEYYQMEFFILEIESLPSIPDPLTNESPLEYPNVKMFYSNGTELPLAIDVLFLILPVGNWSLLSTYYENLYSANISIIDDVDSFGFITFYPSGSYLTRAEVHCSKDDGALLVSYRQVYNEGQVMYTLMFHRGWSEITTTTTTTTTTTNTDTTSTSTDTTTSTTENATSTQTNTDSNQPDTTQTLVLVFGVSGAIVVIVIIIFSKKR